MRKPPLVIAAVLLLLLIFWAGLAANFPGEALSRVVSAKLNRLPNFAVRLSPASLGLISIKVDELTVNLTAAGQSTPVLTLKNVRIPFGWALFSGLPVEAEIGEQGEFDLFVPWEQGEMTISGTELRMEEIPGFRALASARVRGGLNFSGKFQLAPGAQKGRSAGQLPQGTFTARAGAVELSNMGIMGTTLPITRLESAQLAVKTGKRIEVEQLTLRGDVQGGLKGYIQPRLSSFTNSPMQLKLTMSFRQSWLQKLGPMRPIVEGFLKNGRLEAVLRGSLGRPAFRRVGGAG